VKENGINESHLPPPPPVSVEATLAHQVTVTRETGAGNRFRNFYLFQFPAGRGRDKNCNDISVYHDAPSAVITINSSLPLVMNS
jgi:hypothetical protein